MSLFAFAVLNAALAGGVLIALAYVCTIPQRLDGPERPAATSAEAAPAVIGW